MEFPEGRGGGSILVADFGKSRGGEGSYEKSLPWGGYGYFLEPHIAYYIHILYFYIIY